MAYTTIDDPSAHFQTALYTGNATQRNITNDGNSDLQPDWVWIKCRSAAEANMLYDSSRGVTKDLRSETTAANNTNAQGLQAFNSDGFQIGTLQNVNFNTKTMVAWQWKANGGTTTSQTGSDIDSVTQVNADAKFSIVTYSSPSNATADGSNNGGAYWRVKHGLGSVPKVAIFKSTSNVHAWYVWHHRFVGASKSDGDHITLNTVGAMASESGNILWGNTEWSSTEFEIGGWNVINRSGQSYIGYLFDEVQGYSKFGSYIGNGSADGTFVYTGFKPAWIMVKRTDGGSTGWIIYDTARDTFNEADAVLQAHVTTAEVTAADIDILSNGWKFRTTDNAANGSGATYIYMAFAESPFVSSEGVPTTAR